MSDVFNFKRFGKFLSYDLNNAIGSYGISLLIMGLMPVILFFFYELFSLLFGNGINDMDIFVKIIGLVCCAFVLVLSTPSKIYGHLTDKRKGADWILIPASPLEKALTLFLLLCVVAPAVFFAVYCVTDLLLSAVFPGTYGHALCSTILNGYNNIVGEISDGGYLSISHSDSILNGYAGLCSGILSFALGAICFSRNKIGKTILCWFAFSIVCSTILVLLFGSNFSFGEEDLERILENMTPDKAQFYAKFVSTLINVLIFGVLFTAIYFRIKTIKH